MTRMETLADIAARYPAIPASVATIKMLQEAKSEVKS